MTAGSAHPGPSTAVAVVGLGLWLPGFPHLAAWREGRRQEPVPAPKGDALGKMYRRRAGALGRAVADVAAEALAGGAVPLGQVRTVIGSAIGEASTLVRLLDQMWRGGEPMSPADFTVSVHNAASGLLSIASGNRGFTTSLAADYDTPANALYEGLGLVATEGEPVLVVCADEGAPETLLTGEDAWAMAAAAVLLAPAAAAPQGAPRLRLWPAGAEVPGLLAPAALDPDVALNPQVGLVDLVLALDRGARGAVALDRGRGRGFRATVGE
jgi:hypothetical protein